MHIKLLILLSSLHFLVVPAPVNAAPRTEASPSGASPSRYKPLNAIHHNFSVSLGLDLGGPVLFNDTPDATIDELTAFKYGGSLSFMLGDEIRDFHRFGLGVSYAILARSEDRSLAMITPYLAYEIGHPFMLQIRVGYAIASGTEGFAENYAGAYGGISLKYSFRNKDTTSPVSVSAALAADAVLSAEAPEYATVFMGVKLEITYHK